MAKYTAMVSTKGTEKSRYILINKTGEKVFENDNPVQYAELRKKAMASLNRQSRDDALRSMGLKKVRGAVSGNIYWE